MPLSLQVKLLRTLQEMEFERVGGTRTIRVDVRVLSASNRDIKEFVAEGVFREDLFYRLNVIHIEVPSLSERIEDIRLLVDHFIEKYRQDGAKESVELSPETWKALYNHIWPGNIRELENVIERAVVLNPGGVIELEDLPADFSRKREEIDVSKFIPANVPLQQTLEQIEEQLIRRALSQCNNIQSHAADMLSITKSLFQHKMKKYKIII
jgi:two-component system NtrC family response regulator